MTQLGDWCDMAKDLWSKKVLDEENIHVQIDRAIFYLGKLSTDVYYGSILTDLDYDEVVQAVEKLYTLLRIDLLAQDTQRRHDAHMEEVRKVNEKT